MYSDESNVEIDIITTGQLPSQPNFSIDPLATDSPINQQQSNLNANDCDSSPSILDQQDQPLKRNNEASTFASKNARFIKRSTFYQFVKINGRTQRLYRKSVKTKASMKIGSMFVSKMKKSIVSIERIMFKNGTCILKNSETNTRMFLRCHQVGVRKLFSYLTMKWKLHELMMLNWLSRKIGKETMFTSKFPAVAKNVYPWNGSLQKYKQTERIWLSQDWWQGDLRKWIYYKWTLLLAARNLSDWLLLLWSLRDRNVMALMSVQHFCKTKKLIEMSSSNLKLNRKIQMSFVN